MLRFSVRASFAAALVVVFAVPLHAELILDQRQQNLDIGTAAIGGSSSQRLAQVVTAGITGPLAEVRMPIACDSGTLILDIVRLDASGLPEGTVLRSIHVPASDLPSSRPPIFQAFEFRPRLPMRAGDVFAIRLSNPTGVCGAWHGGPDDVYAGGPAFFNDAANGFRWIDFKTFPDRPQSLAFETWIEPHEPRRSGFVPCEVPRWGSVPIPSFTPLCRCFEDDFPREQRCAFLHPSFMLIRRIPLPLTLGKPFEVSWTLVPHEPIDGLLQIVDELPPGFQQNGKIVFDARQVPPGETLTQQYEGVAGFKSGSFHIETFFRLSAEEGRMRTSIDLEE